MRPARIVILSVIAVLALTGCSPDPGPGVAAPADPAETAASTQPATDGPFTCAELVGQADVDEALASASVASGIGGAVPYLTPVDVASTVAGGIRCVWLADPSADRSGIVLGAPGVPWLDVEVLPGAAAKWSSYTFGDDTTTDRSEQYAGFTGAHDCGDPGCKATAPIGDAWVSIMVHVPSLAGGFAGIAATRDELFAKLTPAASALFTTVSQASAAQLDWPATPAREVDDAVDPCSSFLRGTALSTALGVIGDAEYTTARHDDSTRPAYSLGGAALSETGFVDCAVSAGSARASFTLMLDNAAIVHGLAESATAESPLHADPLELQVSGETAVSNCTADSAKCDLWFTLGSDAIYVSSNSTDSKAVANAILAQAR